MSDWNNPKTLSGIIQTPVNTEVSGQTLRRSFTEKEQNTLLNENLGTSLEVPEYSYTPPSKADQERVFDIRNWGYTINPYEYNESDVVNNPRMMADVRKAATTYFGDIIDLSDKSDREVVDTWYNIMRGTQVNLPRGLTTAARIKWLEANDPEALMDIGRGMAIFESSGNIFGGTWADLGEGIMDYARGALLDPSNLVSAGIGSRVGARVVAKGITTTTQGAIKTQSLRRGAEAAAKERLRAGATSESIDAAAKKASVAVYREGTEKASVQTATEIAAQRAATEAAKDLGVRRFFTKPALAELGTVVGIDTVVGTGIEFLYQNDLVKTGVQDEVRWDNVGIAALGSLLLGGTVGAGMLLRGSAKGVGISERLGEKGDIEAIPSDLAKEIELRAKEVVKDAEWAEKVAAGRSVRVKELDADFMASVMLGRKNDKGETLFPGLSQKLAEEGHGWKKIADDDFFTDWLSDLIRTWDDADVQKLVGSVADSVGIKISDIGDLTSKDFGDRMANVLGDGGKAMNAMSQAAKNLGISMDDLKRMGYFTGDVTDEKIGKLGNILGEVVGARGAAYVEDMQGKVVRLMVSNPSTSWLNAAGWAGASAYNIASDLVWAAMQLPNAAVLKMFGKDAKAKAALDMAKGVVRASANRAKFVLDPKTTYEDFMSFQINNQHDLRKFSEALAGGVEQSDKFFDPRLSPGQRLGIQQIDNAVTIAQRIAAVQGVDKYTKAQEFMYQMDRALRVDGLRSPDGNVVRYKGGLQEFFDPTAEHAENLRKIMNTREYQEMTAKVVERSQEAIFSKSYKGRGLVGEVATLIEDMRKIPGVGLMVPFGRFWNNTIRFVSEASGVALLAKSVGHMKHREAGELFARAAVGWGLVYSFAQLQKDADDHGIPLGSIRLPSGQVQDYTYDFPMALPVIVGRLVSYTLSGKRVPEGMKAEALKIFGTESLFRGLSDSGKDLFGIGSAVVSGDLDMTLDALGKTTGRLGAQVASASTRFLEPANIAVGLIRGDEYVTPDNRQGNRYVNDSMRYIDQFVGVLTGSERPVKQTQTGGKVAVQPQKMTGIRLTMPTIVSRSASAAQYVSWQKDVEAATRDMAPEVANEVAGLVFGYMAEKLEKEKDRGFFTRSPDARKHRFDQILREAKEWAKAQVAFGSYKDSTTADLQFDLASGKSRRAVREAIQDLGLETDDLGDMSRKELQTIIDYLDTANRRHSLETWR